MPYRIPLAKPSITAFEKSYVNDALDTGWIGPNGPYVKRFERTFVQALGVAHAQSTQSGTGALRLALNALGIGPGDEVLVPDLTYPSTANVVLHVGATPVLVDVEDRYWGMDAAAMRAKINERTKACIAVHLYGQPCSLSLINAFLGNIPLIEDCAEAQGAAYRGQDVGTYGLMGCFSFNSAKILACGEGGMVVTNRSDLAERLRLYATYGENPDQKFDFLVPGHNDCLNNVSAAIGCAQLERIDTLLQKRLLIKEWYDHYLDKLPVRTQEWADNRQTIAWLYPIILPHDVGRDGVMGYLRSAGIETRPVFRPLHELPFLRSHENFPVATTLARHGLCLPSYHDLTEADVATIASELRQALHACVLYG